MKGQKVEKKEIERKEIHLDIAIDRFVKLVKVIVYLYSDYSRKFCFVAQTHFQNENMDRPTVRSFYKNVILHSSGQSYETLWKCCCSKRPSKAAWTRNKGKKQFYTITYWNSIPGLLGYQMISKDLERLLITPIQNRFRNVSNDVLKAIEYFHGYGKKLNRKIGKLGVYATNPEVCSVLWDFITSNYKKEIAFCTTTLPRTKRFKKEFFRNPLRLYTAYSNYRSHYRFLGKHLEDHNFFWSLFEAEKCENTAAFLSQNMFSEMVKVTGPAAVIRKVVAADKEIIDDTASMYHRLVDFFDAARINQLLVGSFKDIHDRLVPEYNRIRAMVEYGYGKSYDEMRAEYHALIKMGASREAIKAKRNEVIEYLEVNASRRVRYSARMLSLQTSHDGINFVLPKYTGELEDAGQELHNCVASYKHRLMAGSTTIVFMKREDKLVGCIETHDGYVQQAYGPCNKRLEGIADEAFNMWIHQHKLNGGCFASH